MKKHKTFTVRYRRKREGKTDYHKRIKLLMSQKPRLVIRKSLKDISAQIIEFDNRGDKVITSAKASELSKYGWQMSFSNTPSAYLVGVLIAKKAKEKSIQEVVLDIGLNKSVAGSRIYAVLKGAIDSGLSLPYSESILPDENRIKGKHIEEYASKLKENPETYNKKFSGYSKKNIDPSSVSQLFEQVKNKIVGA